jgi:hypothetical protein
VDREKYFLLQISDAVWHWFQWWERGGADFVRSGLLQLAIPLRRALYGTLAIPLGVHIGAVVSEVLLGGIHSF